MFILINHIFNCFLAHQFGALIRKIIQKERATENGSKENKSWYHDFFHKLIRGKLFVAGELN